MNRQLVLNHFVQALHSNFGRAINERGVAQYILEDHPGCAIGCQPGFREKFKNNREIKASIPLEELVESHKLWDFFKINNDEDILFLKDLQKFHDDDNNWDGKDIKKRALKKFCVKWNLQNLLKS